MGIWIEDMVESSEDYFGPLPVRGSVGSGRISGGIGFGKSPAQRMLHLVALVLGMALLASMLSGCGTRIEVLSRVFNSPLPAATIAQSEHGVSILGVAFDPPMEGTTINLTDPEAGITLMVAVGNQGQSDEHDVQVTATLNDPSGGPTASDLLNETVTVDVLRAGEVRVVRFAPVTQLPQRDRYQLYVVVQPVKGEAETADNFHTYDIIVHRGS